MDDILVFAHTHDALKSYVNRIVQYAKDELQLRIKQPVISSAAFGVSFLGYSVYPNKILLNRRSKIRFKKKMCEYAKLYSNAVWTEDEYRCHLIPLLAFAQKAYTKGLRAKICEKIYS